MSDFLIKNYLFQLEENGLKENETGEKKKRGTKSYPFQTLHVITLAKDVVVEAKIKFLTRHLIDKVRCRMKNFIPYITNI